MQNHPAHPLVACLNSGKETARLLVEVSGDEGLCSMPCAAPVGRKAGITIAVRLGVRPQACVYTVSLPYRENRADFQVVRRAVSDCARVVAVAGKRSLDEIVGPDESVEIIGVPRDAGRVAGAARRALDAA